MGNKYLEIDYLRTIAVILLVVWHCFFCPMFIWGVVEPQDVTKPFMLISSFFIVDATMPLFTFISGYLFMALYVEKGKYRDFVSFLKNKTQRLLIPFFLFSTLIIETSFQLEFSTIIWGEGCHLWYCAMLFWCFMIGWALLRLNSKIINWIIIGASVILVMAYPNFWFLPFQLPLGIDNSLYYYSFFAMGGAIFIHRNKILDIIAKKLVLFWLLYVCVYLVKISGLFVVSRLAFTLQNYLLLLIIWATISGMVNNQTLRGNKWISKLCRCSFGIYVFHHWIAWDIVWYSPFTELLEKHIIIFPTILTVGVFILSFSLTWLLLKTRIGRLLLL